MRGPLPDSKPSSHDAYSEPWGLKHLLRRDIEQADVAALMSALLGIDWPANSVGVLPDVDHTRPGYLSATMNEQAKASLVNAKVSNTALKYRRGTSDKSIVQVVLEHYRLKHGTTQLQMCFQYSLMVYKLQS